MRTAESRPYRMVKRARKVDETRRRITEAALRLHTTVGPARTTISGVAEEAGVTRLTVYRHFPEVGQLYAACTAHWLMQHPPPDPATWLEVPPGERRARHALDELYAWYRARGEDLLPIARDLEAMPQSVQEGMRAAEEAMARALIEGWKSPPPARRRLRAASGHLVSFWTWRSLAVEQGLPHREAVGTAVVFLRAAGR